MVVVVKILLEHFFSSFVEVVEAEVEVVAVVEVEVVVVKLGQCGGGEAQVVWWSFRLQFR